MTLKVIILLRITVSLVQSVFRENATVTHSTTLLRKIHRFHKRKKSTVDFYLNITRFRNGYLGT